MPDEDEAICPHCKKKVGIESNPYSFRSVNFSPVRGIPRPQAPAQVQIISILCNNCNRVLGFVNA